MKIVEVQAKKNCNNFKIFSTSLNIKVLKSDAEFQRFQRKIKESDQIFQQIIKKILNIIYEAQ